MTRGGRGEEFAEVEMGAEIEAFQGEEWRSVHWHRNSGSMDHGSIKLHWAQYSAIACRICCAFYRSPPNVE
jgi:hypothetical protein